MKALFFILTLWLQIQSVVPITVQVRYLDGNPFEQPIHIRNDEGEPLHQCQPDVDGRCTLELARGLYLVEPTGTQLDTVSAAAAVEIGGRWLAITVGDEPLEYGFVIDEGAVYFDAAPNEPRPHPIRPTQTDLEAHFEISEADGFVSESAETTPTPNSLQTEPPTQSTPVPPQLTAINARQRLLRWFLFLLTFMLGIVAIGWFTQRKNS